MLQAVDIRMNCGVAFYSCVIKLCAPHTLNDSAIVIYSKNTKFDKIELLKMLKFLIGQFHYTWRKDFVYDIAFVE